MEYRSVEDWSFEQARTENARLSESEKFKPNAPIFRWGAMRRLDQLQQEFKNRKNGFSVLAAIRVCANHDVVLPAWLADAFIARYDKVLACKVDSWDKAFDRPYSKGKHIAALREKRLARLTVYAAVRDYIAMHPGTAIDDPLFKIVGRQLRLGSRYTEDCYYEAKRFHEGISAKNAASNPPKRRLAQKVQKPLGIYIHRIRK